jgi:hypothetical protein
MVHSAIATQDELGGQEQCCRESATHRTSTTVAIYKALREGDISKPIIINISTTLVLLHTWHDKISTVMTAT